MWLCEVWLKIQHKSATNLSPMRCSDCVNTLPSRGFLFMDRPKQPVLSKASYVYKYTSIKCLAHRTRKYR